jgi:alpha/beta superfamily hydrolase
VALADQRPKHLVAAAHDQFRSPAELAELVSEGPSTTLATVEGADHFFAVGLPAVVTEAVSAINR